jgi:glyoxylase I family protein
MPIDHLAFPAFDVGATHRFYTELLGGSLITAFSGTSEEWGGKEYLMAIYELEGGQSIVFFTFAGIERPEGDGLPRDIRHVAFNTTSAARLDDWRQRLRTARVAFWEEDHGDQQSIYFSDPNDVLLEMTYPATRDVFTRDAGAASLIEAWQRVHAPAHAKQPGQPSARAKARASQAAAKRISGKKKQGRT